MRIKTPRWVIVAVVGGLSGCPSTSTRPSPPALAVAPICTLLVNFFQTHSNVPEVDDVLVYERTDPRVLGEFAHSRALGPPVGAPSIGFRSDIYGINEGWLHNPFSPTVFRAQAVPAPRLANGATGFDGSDWVIQSEDNTATWTNVGVGSANNGEIAVRAVAGQAVPQLMPVGVATPQMFACGGGRTEDNSDTTTWLMELKPQTIVNFSTVPGSADSIQDMLNGDDHFVPNASGGPLIGPANPPTPRVSGPGNPIHNGFVKCAMRQAGDDVTTRELHMVGISGGHLYHSVSSNFGPVTGGGGFVFNRFRSVSSWDDLGQRFGQGNSTVVGAAVVSLSDNAISVLYLTESNGRARLWNAVRFSTTGQWRTPDEVMLQSGDWPNGSPYHWQVTGGMCPLPPDAHPAANQTELTIALWGGPTNLEFGVVRSVPASVQWRPGVFGTYSPYAPVDHFVQPDDGTVTIPDIQIFSRPFPDNVVPPAP